MVFNLQQMFDIQKELNKHIKTTQNLTDEETRLQAHLCIMVELMELCNETRCFNYWSKKQRSSDEVILEEMADVICFLITPILDLNNPEVQLDTTIKAEDKLQLTQRFIDLTALYSKLNFEQKQTYLDFFVKLIELGFALGYSYEQIYDAYLKKVQKNHRIQDEFKK